MAVTTDTHIPQEVLDRIAGEIGADRARQITLPD